MSIFLTTIFILNKFFRTIGYLDCYGELDLLFRDKNSDLVQRYVAEADAETKMKLEKGMIEAQFAASTDSVELFPRGLSAGAFMACNNTGPTEVLILSAENFRRKLFRVAQKELERRIELLKAACIFNDDLSVVDFVRLARMSRLGVYSPGDIILRQGEVPDRMYFVMKGICTVQKRPDENEQLITRLIEMKEQAVEHDMKYSFHHKLRGVLTPAPAEFQRHSDSNFATNSEAERYNLGIEIKKLEAHFAALKKSHAEYQNDVQQVTSLKWPMFFGESAVSVPEGRSSLGTIIADTFCEILWIHKSYLQTFKLKEGFHERLRVRKVRYPSEEALVEQIELGKAWSGYKKNVLEDLSKQRWPGTIQAKPQSMKI